MEQIADMNFMPPFPPIQMVNILNDQINYEDNFVNNASDLMPIEVINQQEEYIIEPENIEEEIPILMRSWLFTLGEFLYVGDVRERTMLQNGWAAVNELELWNFMKQDIDNYCWSDAPEVLRIGAKMGELGYDGHSGASFGWTMRQLQYIGQHGEAAYRDLRRKSE
jgi:hypothetical protein